MQFFNLRYTLCIWVSMVFIMFTHNTYSQDLSSIGNNKNPVKLTGTVSANQILYKAWGIDNRRSPYNYFLNGNLNLSIYGWSCPISFSYSNQQAAFRQPFNQYGIQPTYKWVRGYIGYNSMVFSPYTLNGHIFLGGGVDLTPPGLFHLSAMYGRFQKPVSEDTTNSSIVPAFKRMGGGIKFGIGKNGDFFDIIIFNARDITNSLVAVPEMSDVLPQENMVLGTVWNKKIAERIIFSGEYSSSAYTRDIRSETSSRDNLGAFNLTTPLYKHRTSSSYSNAFRTNLNYATKGFTFGIGYERIDPNYQTMGAYYFNNDLENITLNSSKRILKGRMNIAGNFGVQRNNLNNQKISTMRRYVGAINIMYAPTPKWNLAGGYSNFQTFTRIRSEFEKINQLTPYNSLDTLNYVQLTQSANFSVGHIIGDLQSKRRRQNINLNLAYQVAGGSYGTSKVDAGTIFYNGNISYSYMIVPKYITITTSVNGNQSELNNNTTLILGPTVALTKGFLENKIKSTISTSWNKSFVNGETSNRIMNIRVGGTYVLKKKHNINLSLITLDRHSVSSNQKSFTEFTGTLGYSYNFGL